MQSQPRTLIVAILLLSLISGACRQKQDAVEPPRLLGMEPISAASVTGYHEILRAWIRMGGRSMTVVHAGPKDGLAFVPDARVKAIKALLKDRSAGTAEEDLINADNYLLLASRFGLIQRVFWIIPYGHLDYINAEERIRSFLRSETSRFRPQEIDSMRFQNGCVSGVLADIEVHICSPATMPSLPEPVLVTIDAGFFPPYAARKNSNSLGLMQEFFDLVALKNISAKAASVAVSPDLQAMRGYLAEEILSILKDPLIIHSERPPDLWALREQVDTLLRLGNARDAARHLDRNIHAFPTDPYLILMRSTAHALLTKRRSALKEMAGLCAGSPLFCRGLADAGVLLRERGDLAGAAEFLKKAVSLQPDLDRARFEYAVTLYRSGKYAEAHKEAEMLLSKPGYAVSSGLLLGDCAYAVHKEEEAIDRYEGALKAYQEAGRYRLGLQERESVSRLKSLYEQRDDKRGLKALEEMSSLE